MKPRILAATAALVLAASAPAHAAFTPGGSFTLTGHLGVAVPPGSPGTACTFQLTLNPTATQVTGVTVSGPFLCSYLSAYNLPWPVSSFSGSPGNSPVVSVYNVAIGSPSVGVFCGQQTLSGTWDNAAPGIWRTYQTQMNSNCLFGPGLFVASPPQAVAVP